MPTVRELAQSLRKPEDEDGDVDMGASDEPTKTEQETLPPLPPQFLVLQLDTRDSVFLFLRRISSGELELVSQRYRASQAISLDFHFGTHLAVNPSSRYMAVGCSEGVFAVYTLTSREEISKRYNSHGRLQIVQSERHFPLHGIILKMDFLYPTPGDEDHVILIVLLVVKGVMKIYLYEWEVSADLSSVKPKRHRPDWAHDPDSLPILLIPLTLQSAFMLVSEKSIRVCQNILQGRIEAWFMPSADNEGLKSGNPLYTAWARPSRLPHYTQTHDDLYIAREDGVVRFLEIDLSEADYMKANNFLSGCQCNIGTAFTCMQDNASDDILLIGGDSSIGGMCRVRISRSIHLFVAHYFLQYSIPQGPLQLQLSGC